MTKITMKPFEIELETEEDVLGFIEELERLITKYSVLPWSDDLEYDIEGPDER